MAVYVDPLMEVTPNARWKWRWSCHLLADSEPELHAFAARLGLKRSWFQKKSAPHYDLTANKRALAVQLGAKEVAGQSLAEVLTRLSRRDACSSAV